MSAGGRIWSLLWLALASGALPAHAQAVRGRLMEGGTDAPAVGAFVTLQDSAGARLVQTVSGSTGRFFLRAPRAGGFTLRVLRIGYPPWEVALPLGAGEVADRSFTLSALRVSLPDVQVEGRLLCGARAGGDSLSAVFWDQARTALSLANEAVSSHRFRYYTVLQDRRVDSTESRSVDLPPRDMSNLVTEWPVRSPPSDSLLANGFILNLEDVVDGPSWYGPDAEYLLSEPFFADHCFQLVPAGPDQPAEWVGLSFTPGRTSARADIRGVLWLDREDAGLRRLDFAYTRLPSWAHGRHAFGQLIFAPVPGGGWIVQRWVLRVPIPEVDYGTRKARFFEYRESGGYVSQVLTADGREVVRYQQ